MKDHQQDELKIVTIELDQNKVEKQKKDPNKKSIFEPTKSTEYIFSILLVSSLLISLTIFPISSLFNPGDSEVEFKVGFPWPFFEVSTNNSNDSPLKFFGLLGDMLIYLLIAYILNVLINVISLKFFPEKKEEPNKGTPEENSYELGKKAYEYYKSKGLTDENIWDLFKLKGWTDYQLNQLKDGVTTK